MSGPNKKSTSDVFSSTFAVYAPLLSKFSGLSFSSNPFFIRSTTAGALPCKTMSRRANRTRAGISYPPSSYPAHQLRHAPHTQQLYMDSSVEESNSIPDSYTLYSKIALPLGVSDSRYFRNSEGQECRHIGQYLQASTVF